MPSTQNILIDKLDEFIRKYYINRFIQGLLISVGGLLAFFLLASLLEYFAHFGQNFRRFLFFSYLIFATVVIVIYWIMPLLKRFRIGKVISYSEASSLIGYHFPEIKDKLLNTLQLQEQAQHTDNELLLASIDQRIQNLSPFKFSSAIDIKGSARQYGKYTLLPLVVLVVILLFQSSMITKPAERIIGFDKQFAREAPFEFVLKNTSLKTLKNSDFKFELEVKGKQLPAVVYIEIDKHLIKMESTGKNQFVYEMANLTNSHSFSFTDGDYTSNTYQLDVLPNPTLVNFKVNLNYPAYINRKNEVLNNVGDFTIPEGTQVEWVIQTKDVESIRFAFGNEQAQVTHNEDIYTVKAKVLRPVNYTVQLLNKYIANKDTMHYALQVISDRHPGIAAEQKKDSINPFVVYFYGKADDDYGISRLNFVYRNVSSNGALKYLPVNIGRTTDEIFYYMIDLRELVKGDGDELEYYFEVWDNDAVNGKKSSKSQVFKTLAPSEQSLRKETESGNKSLKSKMAQMMKDLETMQKRGSELKRELMENDQMDWQQQQKLKDFIAEQKKLEQKAEEIKQENAAQNDKQKQIDPLDEEILKKQEELDKLINSIMTPEMKDMLKKLEEMVKQQNKDAIQNQLDKMKMNNEAIKKELDRSLEQFKQLELEKKINEQTDALQKLAEKQKELAQKTLDKTESKESLKQQQDELNKQFDELKQEIKETEQKNKDLETPLEMESTEKDQQEIDQNMDESAESIDKKQNKKANDAQKKAADKMEEMAAKMKKSLEQAQQEQEEEDYYTLRQILENLIELSVQQESLMDQMKDNRYYSPKYVELSARQQKLKESAKMVEDSLLALSKRQIHIKSFVNKEIGNVNYYMNQAIEDFSKVIVSRGLSNQQYVMTGLNNLAVMLSESLKNMQESMKEKKNDGNSQCKNPGKKKGKTGKDGKPKKMSGMKQMQDELSKQLQQMKDGKQQQGKNPNSEAFAKIAAKQEALRREIERLQKQLNEEGKPGSLGDLEKTKQLMEQQEKDLVNKQITPETMRRMKEIETRMLEHEKAEMEQEMDNQREAEQATEVQKEMPPAIKAYLEKKAKEMELLRSVPSELSPYYKDRVRVYFQKLGNV
jgi:hypothetical protein